MKEEKGYLVEINAVMRLHYLAKTLVLLGLKESQDWLNFMTEEGLSRLLRKLEKNKGKS